MGGGGGGGGGGRGGRGGGGEQEGWQEGRQGQQGFPQAQGQQEVNTRRWECETSLQRDILYYGVERRQAAEVQRHSVRRARSG